MIIHHSLSVQPPSGAGSKASRSMTGTPSDAVHAFTPILAAAYTSPTIPANTPLLLEMKAEVESLDMDAHHTFLAQLSQLRLTEQDQPTQQRRTVDDFRSREKMQRPPLPVSFSFGRPRPKSVAVMMRHPLVGDQAPATPAQAILQTLQLAVTDVLPYMRGVGFFVAV